MFVIIIYAITTVNHIQHSSMESRLKVDHTLLSIYTLNYMRDIPQEEFIKNALNSLSSGRRI